ncbi:MAG: sodium:solute symporter [Gemmatimonadaceae bacterium]|nr:sodium:solute symporter [Gemmatimonadaceae bacterium]
MSSTDAAAAFTGLDWAVLIAYLAGTIALGVWLGRDQKDAKDYFVAGGTIPWWAVLFSIVATETSALTFISIPGLAYLGDFTFLQVATGYLLGRIVVAYTLLPRYAGGELVTAYALLERRFGLATRRFASVTFMATRAFGDSVRVFATAIPIALIIGPIVPAEWLTPVSILALGVATLIYTYEGGMRAVVWTDVIQTVIYLFGGVGAIVLLGQGVEGGWAAILADAGAAGKLRLLDLSTDIGKPHTLFAGVLGGGFLAMASHGADQLIVQRLLTAADLRDSRRALIGSGLAVMAQFALFLFIGIGLWKFYQGRAFPAPDKIFPTFIVEEMPSGMTGVVIAAILAAAMSTISGSLNSLAAATTHDLWIPLKGQGTPAQLLRVSKVFTLIWAVILIGGALLYKAEGTPVVVIALSIASFTYGGLLGGFFLALLWPRAAQRDAILAMAVGISVMSVVVFAGRLGAAFPALAGPLAPVTGIAWPWFVLIGTAITLATGILSSFTHAAPSAPRPSRN